MLGPAAGGVRSRFVRGALNGPPGLRFIRPRNATPALYTIDGVTRDAAGAILGACDVDLFFAGGNKARASATVSDATTGAYLFMVNDTTTPYFIVSYKDGTPVFGTTKKTIFGV
jgi:hypothetical protein